MALVITDACINCGYCEVECPNRAIYEPGMPWTMEEGLRLKSKEILYNGRLVKSTDRLPPLSETYYFIVPEKCDECKSDFERPQCRVVCPNPDSFNRIFPDNSDDTITALITF